jgi:hypothetical protein
VIEPSVTEQSPASRHMRRRLISLISPFAHFYLQTGTKSLSSVSGQIGDLPRNINEWVGTLALSDS